MSLAGISILLRHFQSMRPKILVSRAPLHESVNCEAPGQGRYEQMKSNKGHQTVRQQATVSVSDKVPRQKVFPERWHYVLVASVLATAFLCRELFMLRLVTAGRLSQRSAMSVAALGPPSLSQSPFAGWVRNQAGVSHVDVRQNDKALSWGESASLWQTSEDFRSLTLGLLRQVPSNAFFWETPPFTGSSASRRMFQFVCVDGAHLAKTRADPSDFGLQQGGEIKVFPNLGRDALLVVPTQQPGVDMQAYAHIAAFVRNAPEEQQHEMLKTLGKALDTEMQAGGFYGNMKPVWVNTEGSGVPWLHVRLDSRPKYYHYAAYRSDDPSNTTMPGS